MKFSERYGYKEVNKVLEYEYMSDELKNHIWNTLYRLFLNNFREPINVSDDFQRFAIELWENFFHGKIDEFTEIFTYINDEFKSKYEELEWFEVYDLIEFVISNNPKSNFSNNNCIDKFNETLKNHYSAYRLVNRKVTAVTNKVMINSIESAINETEYDNVSKHLNTALELLTNKKTPDYRNSIKESISAVEAYCRMIVCIENAKFGTALREIEKTHQLHPALKKSFTNLYGYTSDSDGIRHALMNEPNLSYNDALYMLVSCSAFINYLRSKAEVSS